MALNTAQLGTDIANAMLNAIGQHRRLAEPYIRAEADKFARTAELIALGRIDGSINKEQAKILVSMQEGASRAVLTAVETIGAIAAQDAINAGLRVLADAVNAAVGVSFL